MDWQSLSDPLLALMTGGWSAYAHRVIFMSRSVARENLCAAGFVAALSLLVGILTMMARQEYLLDQDKPVEELTKKGQEQCPWPNV